MQQGRQAETDSAHDVTAADLRSRAAGLLRDGRMEDAAVLLAQGRRLFPDDAHLPLDQASLAETMDDPEGAIELLETVIDRHPRMEAAYLRASALCRKIDRPRDAERVLLEGMSWLPSSADMFGAYAAIAADRQDWKQAARRYDLARERFPSQVWTHAHLAHALRRAGRPLEAERALLQGDLNVPHDPHFLIEHAEIAAEHRDWVEAARRFKAARERFPDSWWTCRRHADVLKQAGDVAGAEAVLLEGQRRVPDEPALYGAYADLAFERRDWTESLRRFAIVRDRFPDLWWPYKRLADTLRTAGRPDEAETVLLDGQRRAPDEPALYGDHADVAFERRDWAESLRRFGIIRDRFPALWRPYKRIADTLRAQGHLREAEAVLLDGQTRHPQLPDLFLDHASLAGAAKDWQQALQRFEDTRDRFPELWSPLRGIAETYCSLERFDDADRVMREGIALFPDDPEPLFHHAGLAQWLGQVEEAVERYRIIPRRFPGNYHGHFRLACSVAASRRFDEAESMLVEVMRAFPDERGALTELVQLTIQIPADTRQVSVASLEEMVDGWIERCGEAEDLLLAKAQLAQVVGDYPGYLRRLLHVARVSPSARGIDERIAVARELLLGSGEVAPEELGQAAGVTSDPGNVLRHNQWLLGLFESLGGGAPGGSGFYGCEFGFLQRALTLEPLSLLRWTGVSLPNLTRLLANDFDGVGELENCVLDSIESAYDWHFIDTVYELRCDHTHLDKLTVPQEDALRMMCQRTKFLARKLREDLEDGDKIFVYRYLGPLPDEAELLALADAVNAYGRNMLFFVCRADERHAPLTVRLIRPGLMVGHIDWFASDRHQYPANIEGWTRLCEDAHRTWQEQRAA